MKIVYSLPHPADRLAAERAGHIVRAKNLLDAIERLGHDVIRVEAAADGGTETAVGTYRKSVRAWLPAALALPLRDLGRVAHGVNFARALTAAVERHRPDIILETHISFALAGCLAAARTRTSLILDDVGPIWEDERFGVGLPRVAHRIHHMVTRRASLVVGVNQVMRQHLIEQGVPEDKILLVENGFDPQRFHPGWDGEGIRAAHGIRNDEVVIVFVGSFQAYHRIDLLLDAVAAMRTRRPVRLLLIGNGKLLPAYREEAARKGIADRVVFAGSVPNAGTPACLAAGDIAVLPATNEYGNPMKLYEYMAMGKPTVAPDQPTVQDILTPYRNGLLFAPGSVADLAAAMDRLVDNEDLRTRLGRNALEDSCRHSWDRRARTILEAAARQCRLPERHPALALAGV